MCGIAGYQGSKSPLLIKSMVDAISHRGPDNQSHLILEKVYN